MSFRLGASAVGMFIVGLMVALTTVSGPVYAIDKRNYWGHGYSYERCRKLSLKEDMNEIVETKCIHNPFNHGCWSEQALVCSDLKIMKKGCDLITQHRKAWERLGCID